MKDFSKTIDLGVVDCCCVRHGATEVKFHFWFRENDSVLDATASKDYGHSWLVDALFYNREQELIEEARKTAEVVMQQLEMVGDGLEDGVALTIKDPVLKEEATEDYGKTTTCLSCEYSNLSVDFGTKCPECGSQDLKVEGSQPNA